MQSLKCACVQEFMFLLVSIPYFYYSIVQYSTVIYSIVQYCVGNLASISRRCNHKYGSGQSITEVCVYTRIHLFVCFTSGTSPCILILINCQIVIKALFCCNQLRCSICPMYIVFEPGVLSGIFSALAYLLNACFLGISLVKPCFLGFVAYLLSICFLSVFLLGIWFSLGVPFCLLCILCILGVAVSQLDYTGQVH